LQKVIQIVREPIKQQWESDLQALVNNAQAWCSRRNWQSKIIPRRMSERMLGEYDAPQLMFSVGPTSFVLNPVSRFAPGTSGLVDLAVLPTYESVLVTKSPNAWYVNQPTEEDGRREWSEDAFVSAADILRSAA
jgi:hypothetical protein